MMQDLSHSCLAVFVGYLVFAGMNETVTARGSCAIDEYRLASYNFPC